MAMPRVLSLASDGFLQQAPAPEFGTLRGERRTATSAALTGQPLPLGISGDSLEIQAEFSADSATSVGLRVRCPSNGAGGTEIVFHPQRGTLAVGSVQKLIGNNRQLRLRLFLDKRVMEAYINDGEAAVFTTIDAAPGDLGTQAFAKGGTARLESFQAWPLSAARFSLDRFKA
jgi:beta-fructofuranosidase